MPEFSPRFMATTLPTMPHRALRYHRPTLTPEQAEKVFQYTKNISRRLRQKYFGATAGF